MENLESWQQYAVEQYVQNKRSLRSIGNEVGKNPKTIRDALLRAGVTMRTKSAAQKLNIERNGPPITRPRTLEEKKKISRGVTSHLDSLPEEEREALRAKISEASSSYWGSLSKEEKEAALLPMKIGNREQVGVGSRLENTLSSMLTDAGHIVWQRDRDVINPYEIDIYLPNEGVAIECDGPTHFSAIYGIENLERRQAKDEEKNILMKGRGLFVIRVQDHTTSFSLAACERTISKIKEKLSTIKRRRCPAVWIVEHK